MKTLTMWLVMLVPTQECIDKDRRQNEVQVVVIGSTQTVNVRPNGTPPPPVQTLLQPFIQESQPAVDDQGCYDVYIGRSDFKTTKTVDQAKRKADAEAKAKADAKKAAKDKK